MISAAITGCLHALAPPGAALAEWAAASLRPLLGAPDPDATGLWVAAPDLGAAQAVAFWADARAQGLAFASPAAFPWTLSSALAGHLARSLDVRGPVTNFVGGPEAELAAVVFAASAISRRAVAHALVVGLVAAEPMLSAVLLGPSGRSLSIGPLAGSTAPAPPKSGLLRALARAAPVPSELACPPYGTVRFGPP